MDYTSTYIYYYYSQIIWYFFFSTRPISNMNIYIFTFFTWKSLNSTFQCIYINIKGEWNDCKKNRTQKARHQIQQTIAPFSQRADQLNQIQLHWLRRHCHGSGLRLEIRKVHLKHLNRRDGICLALFIHLIFRSLVVT